MNGNPRKSPVGADLPIDPRKARRQAIRFIAVAYGITWVCWVPLAILDPSRMTSLPFLMVGGFGPTIAAFLISDREGRRDLRYRFLDLERIGGAWWGMLLLFHPLSGLASNWIVTMLGGSPVGLDRATLGNPASFAVWLAIMIVGGPLAEEFGWRGYLLDRLQVTGGAVRASLALAFWWTLWHLPLFFMTGTSQAALGFGSVGFWIWAAQVVGQTPVYTWIYNNTGRSIFAACLFHFMANAVFSAVAGVSGRLPDDFALANATISVAAGVVVMVVWRARTTRVSWATQ